MDQAARQPQQLQGKALYMITLPDGRLYYSTPGGEGNNAVDLSSAEEWPSRVPPEWRPALSDALEQVKTTRKNVRVNVPQTVHVDEAITAFLLVPWLDGEQNIVAIAWMHNLPSDYIHHYRMFHRSAIAQWIMDPRAIFHYLHLVGINTPAILDQRLREQPDLFALLRQRFSVMDANESAASLYGLDTIGQFMDEIVRNAGDTEVRLACHAILAMSDENYRQVYQTQIGEGDNAKSLWISCEIPSKSSMEEGMFISALNITPLKMAEQESEEREQFLATILRAVPDILMVFDLRRRQPIFQNVDLIKMLGYSKKDLQDTGGHIFSYIAHPDDAMQGESVKAMYARLAAGEVYETTVRLQHNNGEWRHFYFRSAALDKDEKGNILNAVVVARDITDVLKAQQILDEQQRRYRLLSDNFSDVVMTTDSLLRINYVSPSVKHLLGYVPEEFIRQKTAFSTLGISDGEISHLAQALADTVLRVDSIGDDFDEVMEAEALTADGRVVPIELKASILRDEHNLLEGFLIVVRDITERRKADAQQRLAAKVFENSVEAIYITNKTGDIIQVNKAFTEITGYQPEAVIGQKPSQLGAGWHEVNFHNDIKPVLDKDGQWSGEIMSRRASGEAFLVWMSISYVHDSRGCLLGAITSFRDITEAKSSEESIRKLAYYDPLTDLPNRMLFHDRLLQALQRASRNRHYVAILFLDLDGFKAVNDALGHALGDRLLTETARRLKDCIRNEDTVARMGGDEFTVILSALSNRETAESGAAQVARKIIKRINEPFHFDDKVAHIGTSIGIALYPDDSIKEEELVRMADTAMYHTKQSGKNGYQFYTTDMHQRAEMRQAIENELSHALMDDEFVLAFQPKLLAITQELYGFEALLRWQHPQKGLMLPSAFMRTLDDLELSSRIGSWVIYKACSQMREWVDKGIKVSGISVNIFANQYHSGELPRVVAEALHKTGISPEMLTVEITEKLIMSDIGFAYALLTDLKTLGVRVSIDDFASSMFSLQSLNRLPVDEIKIDRQFISSIDSEKEQYRLVKAIINIANIFGFDVVAEGVERATQLDALLGADCPKVQGYLFYKPLLRVDLDNYLEQLVANQC